MRQFFQSSIIFLALLLSVQAIAQQPKIDNFRDYGQEGINVFEAPKDVDTQFDGVRVRVGGAFAQQFQALDHTNEAVLNKDEDPFLENALIKLKPGFNLATANMNIDAQLADGVRLNLVSYMSSRHHSETWVKGGYIQFDKLPFLNSTFVDNIMEKTTIKVGHMEVNYGDAHFRRTDNGNALYNPFVGNYILDAFNTEIGAEVMYRQNGALALFSVTGGEIKGDILEVTSPETDDKAKRSPSFIGKLGYDSQLSENVRLRITGSVYYTPSSNRNFLYGGDRGGSRYYLVLTPALVESTGAVPGPGDSGVFTSGRYNPSYLDKVTAIMGNVFFKAYGFELFGTYETAEGRMNFETENRPTSQIAVDALYRFGKKESFYLGGRYNTMTSEQVGGNEISIDRVQLGAGWFVTPNILMKGEYVNQNYNDFITTDILHGGNFNGFMIEAVVGF
ncbi:MAG TPA: hypothetical protein PKA00_08555 [Saprospiraceae bacterium]|nr:hypothetical protein [Saprospiraceae bacterium]HMQ82945.1 hypothetical protein [Saprospiraceae bacterium]